MWPWVIFHRSLRKICILLLMDRAFHKCQLHKVDCAFQFICILINFCLLDVSITERGLLKSSNILENWSLSSFSCISLWVMYFNTLMLDVFVFRIVLPSQRNEPLPLCNAFLYPQEFCLFWRLFCLKLI